MGSLTLRVMGGDESVEVQVRHLVAAGYTGRDEAEVRAHIDELAELGVAPPEAVPMFYVLDPSLVTTASPLRIASGASSGEVEPVLVCWQGEIYLGVGSDHTDRDLETTSVLASKAACPKPVGPEVVRLVGEKADLDGATMRSRVDGVEYQAGSLARLRPPYDLLARVRGVIGDDLDGLVLFCGTVPVLSGQFCYGSQWELELVTEDGACLAHRYVVQQEAT
jgi:4-hydroxyphenylacetate 3-monooxygenase